MTYSAKEAYRARQEAGLCVRCGERPLASKALCVSCREVSRSRSRDKARRKGTTYHVWGGMLARCTRPTHTAWHNYGGRGISVCERWRVYENFVADMGLRPEGRTLDRIDNDGNYEPGNCRWATQDEQNSNTRVSRRVTAFGRTLTVAQWSRETGIIQVTLLKRLDRGWPPEKALSVDPLEYLAVHGRADHASSSLRLGQ